MLANLQFPANLVQFNVETLNGNFIFGAVLFERLPKTQLHTIGKA